MILRPRGFTLLELIVVIVIIGILATLGFVSYTELMERARDAEAIRVLKVWMSNIDMHYLENNSLVGASDSSLRPTGVPINCSSNYYFSYGATTMHLCRNNDTLGTVRLIAERCSSGGKPPQGKERYVVLDKHYADNGRMEIIKRDLSAGIPDCP